MVLVGKNQDDDTRERKLWNLRFNAAGLGIHGCDCALGDINDLASAWRCLVEEVFCMASYRCECGQWGDWICGFTFNEWRLVVSRMDAVD